MHRHDASAATESNLINLDSVAHDLGLIAPGVALVAANTATGHDISGIKEDTISGFEDARGGAAGDVIYGSAANNFLNGNGGGDNLLGFGGNDFLIGGDGADGLAGGAGADELRGGADGDVFQYSSDLDPALALPPAFP
jgi:Ca2+-binding RTX toxin-like protein